MKAISDRSAAPVFYPMLEQAGSSLRTHKPESDACRRKADGEMKTERKDSVVSSFLLPHWALSHLVMCLFALCPMLWPCFLNSSSFLFFYPAANTFLSLLMPTHGRQSLLFSFSFGFALFLIQYFFISSSFPASSSLTSQPFLCFILQWLHFNQLSVQSHKYGRI